MQIGPVPQAISCARPRAWPPPVATASASSFREFQAAADLVPASEPLIRAQYLTEGGLAMSYAGMAPHTESELTEALRIREKLLAPDHTSGHLK